MKLNRYNNTNKGDSHMKKIIFTLSALILFTLTAQAYNYSGSYPSNNFGGQTSIVPGAPKANGSAQTYQNMVNTSQQRSLNTRRYRVYQYSNQSGTTVKRRKHRSNY